MKNKKRIFIAFGSVVLVVALFVGSYIIRQNQQEEVLPVSTTVPTDDIIEPDEPLAEEDVTTAEYGTMVGNNVAGGEELEGIVDNEAEPIEEIESSESLPVEKPVESKPAEQTKPVEPSKPVEKPAEPKPNISQQKNSNWEIISEDKEKGTITYRVPPSHSPEEKQQLIDSYKKLNPDKTDEEIEEGYLILNTLIVTVPANIPTPKEMEELNKNRESEEEAAQKISDSIMDEYRNRDTSGGIPVDKVEKAIDPISGNTSGDMLIE
ncbi:MAG: hypothetical protein GX272_12980 [Epulopiscium sp.]|nr:hypothetical protein [Candidatus Epulonipiscium sp.]